MIKKALKFLSPVLQRVAKYYFRKPRPFSYKGLKGMVLPDVFYPIFTISTKLLMDFIDDHELKDKRFLELGCGTGIISTLAAKKGALVIASDINPAAIENVELNAGKNGVKVQSILSDLFEGIPQQVFDYIIINPPYYPKDPLNKAEEAWYCGANFEYFEKLFHQLGSYFDETSQVYMILSEDCELEKIKSIAAKKKSHFEKVLQTIKQGEKNSIFRIRKS
jgi:release factor glutamine methyltransferase